MSTTELKARIEEIEALANYVPPDLLAQRLLSVILKIWPNPTADPLPIESIRQRLTEWQPNSTKPKLDEPGEQEPLPEAIEPELIPVEAQEEPPEELESSLEKPRPRGRPVTVRRDQNGKECTKCGEWKPKTEFHKRSDTSDGRSSHCKECRKSPIEQAERLCAKGDKCVAAQEEVGIIGHPAILAASSTSPLCERCQRRAGLAS